VYSKILVAVDFTEDAAEILAKAKALAEVHHAALVLVHVTEPAALSAAMIGPDGLGMVTEDVELDQQLVEAARQKMTNLAREAGLEGAEIRVELGIPSDILVRLAEEAAADLIVVGHHQRRGLAFLFGASTDSGVLHHAPCDVLAVRP
jgi:universal stress protein A